MATAFEDVHEGIVTATLFKSLRVKTMINWIERRRRFGVITLLKAPDENHDTLYIRISFQILRKYKLVRRRVPYLICCHFNIFSGVLFSTKAAVTKA